MEPPDTRYTWSGDFSIAYQVVGEGPATLVYLPGYMANVDANWRVPPLAEFLEALASFCRLVVMDRRGLGCSDRLPPGQAATLEEMVDDVIAVTEAAMCEWRTFLFGTTDSAFVAMLAAAAHPDRFAGLILFSAAPTYRRSDDVPWMTSDDQWAAAIARQRRTTSAAELGHAYMRIALPSLAGDRDVAADDVLAARERLLVSGLLERFKGQVRP
jgi:pimeloyl-ACP methyl ester carboxylesterase